MINLKEYGYTDFFNKEENKENLIIARVVEVHRERYKIVTEHGETNAKLKGSVYYNGLAGENYPTTGDFVQIDYNQSGDSLIYKTLERKSHFSRKDPDVGRGEQTVAANFDYVFILTSLNYDFNLNRIQRYLTVAWQSGGIPVVVLTKADLVEDYDNQLQEVQKIAVGADVLVVSAKTGLGIQKLSEYLKPAKTFVFLGSSGVGKSSLVNILAGEDIMTVSSIREGDSKGRHTTTHRQLVMLKSGVMIIDTPGMRELGMWDISEGLGEAFSDIEELFTECRYSNCTHKIEPNCAVLSALESGMLEQSRWENYLQLKREAKYTDDKAGYLKEKQQWSKSIAKFSKNKKKFGRK